MANLKKPQAQPTTKESPYILLLTGVVCLAIGLVVGFYFGRQNPEVGGTAPAATTQSSVADPVAFVQNEANFKAMVAANPKDINALIQLGNLYYDNARYREAVEWYGRALEVEPRNPDVLTDRGTSFWNLNQPDAAIADFRKALAIDPAHAQTLYNMGVVYMNGKNEPAETRKAWQTLLATNPNYPDRAKVEQQLATLGAPMPGQTTPAAATSGQQKSSSPAMEDILGRMKQRR
jgi:cytochrome c-type biogenesis protein CcmH/NrfG